MVLTWYTTMVDILAKVFWAKAANLGLGRKDERGPPPGGYKSLVDHSKNIKTAIKILHTLENVCTWF